MTKVVVGQRTPYYRSLEVPEAWKSEAFKVEVANLKVVLVEGNLDLEVLVWGAEHLRMSRT